jgi:hypothetical protein
LPFCATPPVIAMLKPTLTGSAAAVRAQEKSRTVAKTDNATVLRRTDRVQSFIKRPATGPFPFWPDGRSSIDSD